jgi:hypothetical protein
VWGEQFQIFEWVFFSFLLTFQDWVFLDGEFLMGLARKKHWCPYCGGKQMRFGSVCNLSLYPVPVKGYLCLSCGFHKESGEVIPLYFINWLRRDLGLEMLESLKKKLG